MPGHELELGVRPVDLVDAGDREASVIALAEQAQAAIRKSPVIQLLTQRFAFGCVLTTGR